MRTHTIGSESKISHLARLDLFAGATPAELGDLAQLFELTTARPGQTLEVQDAPVRFWHLIVSGHAVVERDGTPLGLLGQGDSWSEHSLLNLQRSSIGVVALSPMTLLSITDRQFAGLWQRFPVLSDRIVTRSAASPDRLALPVLRALLHMESAAQLRANRQADRQAAESEAPW